MFAPGAGSSTSYSLPGRNQRLPAVDAHVVRPETREELIGGKVVYALPAKAPHARQHIHLAYVLNAHVAEGYLGAVDMLTRAGHEFDFAPDASVYPAERDPETGGRRLEELAFEVCSEQALEVPTTKARELARRGVRRVFCLLVEEEPEEGAPKRRRRQHGGRRLLEWSRATNGWAPLAEGGEIVDRCLARPLSVRALLDAAAGDDAVAEALRARGNRLFQEERALGFAEGEAKGEARGRAEGEAKGEARGRATAILEILEERGLSISGAARKRILACTDLDQLKRWTRQAATVPRARDLR